MHVTQSVSCCSMSCQTQHLQYNRHLMMQQTTCASYVQLYHRGILSHRREEAYRLLQRCRLCPRGCGVDRLTGETGYCRAGREPEVSSFNRHMGEEPPISGTKGSGTIFFAHCNLRCSYCQNYPISQLGHGRQISTAELAQMMLGLQSQGCHNINVVTPSHYVPQVLAGLEQAAAGGLHIPLVYNCSGYDLVSTLRLLGGVVDIYMPDMKYGDPEAAARYSDAPDYFAVAQAAIKEMYRQVGELQIDARGVATRGLLVRHLVLPGRHAGSARVLKFLRQQISPHVYVSIMSQYFPAHRAENMPELNRRVTRSEYEAVVSLARRLGLDNGWHQPYAAL